MVPTNEIRPWVLAAYDEGLWENGEYVIIYTNQELPSQELYEFLTSESIWKDTSDAPDGRDEDVKKMMESMMMVSGEGRGAGGIEGERNFF